jgi:hypothetical protein
MFNNSQGADAWVAPGEEHVHASGLEARLTAAVTLPREW